MADDLKHAAVGIGKLEAARRQLDCAIRLYFADEDSLSIHTLAQAAFRILFDIYPHQRADGFEQKVDALIQKLGWKELSHVPNFLKHADRDPNEILNSHSAEHAESILGFGSILHHRIAGEMTPEMRAFDALVQIMNPEFFEIPPDEDPEFDAQFRESVKLLKAGQRSERLMLGTTLIKFYRQYPDIGGFGAKREPGWSD